MIKIVSSGCKCTCNGCEQSKADISIQGSVNGLHLCAACLNKLGAQINAYFDEIRDRVVPMNIFVGKPASEGSPDAREWTLKEIVDDIIHTFEITGRVEFNTKEKGGGFSAEEIVKELSSRGYYNFMTGRDINRTICKYKKE